MVSLFQMRKLLCSGLALLASSTASAQAVVDRAAAEVRLAHRADHVEMHGIAAEAEALPRVSHLDVLDAVSRILAPRPWIKEPGTWISEPGSWIQYTGPGILDSGTWIQDPKTIMNGKR